MWQLITLIMLIGVLLATGTEGFSYGSFSFHVSNDPRLRFMSRGYSLIVEVHKSGNAPRWFPESFGPLRYCGLWSNQIALQVSRQDLLVGQSHLKSVSLSVCSLLLSSPSLKVKQTAFLLSP
jgi:hypothetical protein